MADLLIEIICEEIPARMQARAAVDLERLMLARLKDAGLVHGPSRHFVAPRHLALYVEGLAERQEDISEERRGPRADAPDLTALRVEPPILDGTCALLRARTRL